MQGVIIRKRNLSNPQTTAKTGEPKLTTEREPIFPDEKFSGVVRPLRKPLKEGENFLVRFFETPSPQGVHVNKPNMENSRAAGFLLRARLEEPLVIQPHSPAIVGVGYCVHLPRFVCGMVCSRRDKAERGLIVLNAPGIIGADNRDEIQVLLFNCTDKPFVLNNGAIIAEMIITRICNNANSFDDESLAKEESSHK